MNEIFVAIITGVLSIVGIIITNFTGNKKVEGILETKQAVTDCKIEELTREVRKHNNFAERMPIVEEKITNLSDRVKILEKR